MRRRGFLKSALAAALVAAVPATMRAAELWTSSGPEIMFSEGAEIVGVTVDGKAILSGPITLMPEELLQISVPGAHYQVWFIQFGLTGCVQFTEERGWQNCYNSQVPQNIIPTPMSVGGDRSARFRALYTRTPR